MAFDVLCKNCGDCEAAHHDIESDGNCVDWEAEEPLTEDQREELRRAGIKVTH